MTIEKYISPFIQSHFPEFYKEYGPNFIAFVRSYYEWLETAGGIDENGDPYRGGALAETRRLFEYGDIDNTLDDSLNNFVKYFKNKYMLSVPQTIAADKRLLIKHITDLYRAKGSIRAYELLFRILYDEDITVYIPGHDLFRLSDNQYIRPKYIEVSDNIYLNDLIGKYIKSSDNSGTAVVQNYITKTVNNKVLNILILDTLNGSFKYGQHILCEDLYVNSNGTTLSYLEYSELTESEQADYNLALTMDSSPVILGSLSGISIIDGGADFSVGDYLTVIGDGEGAKARVASVVELNNKIDFEIVNGGSGYTTNATITITGGGGGTGATFNIGSINNIETLSIYLDIIGDHVTEVLNDSDWESFTNATVLPRNLSSVIGTVLGQFNIEVGSIETLSQVNSGNNYVADLNVSVVQENVAAMNIPDGSGGFKGNNAVITGTLTNDTGVIIAVDIEDSGFGYTPQKYVDLIAANTSNQSVVNGRVIINNYGIGTGYFTNRAGFLSDTQHIIDSYYWQNQSYDIISTKMLRTYEKFVRDLVHPAGVAMFGTYRFKSVIDNESTSPISCSVTSF